MQDNGSYAALPTQFLPHHGDADASGVLQFAPPLTLAPAYTAGSPFTITLNKGAELLANPAASLAFDRARAYWESLIVDPVHVIIDADLAALGDGVLGQTMVQGVLQTGNAGYDLVTDSLIFDQRAQVGATDITERLPHSAQATFAVFSFAGFVDFTIEGMSLTTANAKALGLPGVAPDAVDASIVFSSQFAFDFDRSDGIDANSFDFEGVAIHEIGHALGFVSEIDTVDFLLATTPLPFTGTLFPTPLDLYRLAPGEGDADFTNATRILTPSFFGLFGEQVSYFGPGQEYAMSEGAFFGDGAQASHWKDGLGIGILDPTFAPGELGVFTAADLRAFDLIGWDLAPAPVPLPETAWMLVAGVLGLAFAMRRSGVQSSQLHH